MNNEQISENIFAYNKVKRVMKFVQKGDEISTFSGGIEM